MSNLVTSSSCTHASSAIAPKSSLTGYLNASGKIPETLRNDMVFHKVMSASRTAQLGLCCSLKWINPADVTDIRVTNPIDYGKETTKKIILDVRIELNHREIMNIEVMSYYPAHWENRSLLYLCRCFDNIGEGDDYGKIKPATQIGILSIPLEWKKPEFYAHYYMTNTMTGEIYTTHFALNVLNLKYIELASEEDKRNKVDFWARLFLADTWEDFHAIAKNDPAFQKVGEVMYEINASEKERSLCEAHRKYMEEYNSQFSSGFRKGTEDAEMRLGLVIEEKDKQLAEKDRIIAELTAKLKNS